MQWWFRAHIQGSCFPSHMPLDEYPLIIALMNNKIEDTIIAMLNKKTVGVILSFDFIKIKLIY